MSGGIPESPPQSVHNFDQFALEHPLSAGVRRRRVLLFRNAVSTETAGLQTVVPETWDQLLDMCTEKLKLRKPAKQLFFRSSGVCISRLDDIKDDMVEIIVSCGEGLIEDSFSLIRPLPEQQSGSWVNPIPWVSPLSKQPLLTDPASAGLDHRRTSPIRGSRAGDYSGQKVADGLWARGASDSPEKRQDNSRASVFGDGAGRSQLQHSHSSQPYSFDPRDSSLEALRKIRLAVDNELNRTRIVEENLMRIQGDILDTMQRQKEMAPPLAAARGVGRTSPTYRARRQGSTSRSRPSSRATSPSQRPVDADASELGDISPVRAVDADNEASVVSPPTAEPAVAARLPEKKNPEHAEPHDGHARSTSQGRPKPQQRSSSIQHLLDKYDRLVRGIPYPRPSSRLTETSLEDKKTHEQERARSRSVAGAAAAAAAAIVATGVSSSPVPAPTALASSSAAVPPAVDAAADTAPAATRAAPEPLSDGSSKREREITERPVGDGAGGAVERDAAPGGQPALEPLPVEVPQSENRLDESCAELPSCSDANSSHGPLPRDPPAMPPPIEAREEPPAYADLPPQDSSSANRPTGEPSKTACSPSSAAQHPAAAPVVSPPQESCAQEEQTQEDEKVTAAAGGEAALLQQQVVGDDSPSAVLDIHLPQPQKSGPAMRKSQSYRSRSVDRSECADSSSPPSAAPRNGRRSPGSPTLQELRESRKRAKAGSFSQQAPLIRQSASGPAPVIDTELAAVAGSAEASTPCDDVTPVATTGEPVDGPLPAENVVELSSTPAEHVQGAPAVVGNSGPVDAPPGAMATTGDEEHISGPTLSEVAGAGSLPPADEPMPSTASAESCSLPEPCPEAPAETPTTLPSSDSSSKEKPITTAATTTTATTAAAAGGGGGGGGGGDSVEQGNVHATAAAADAKPPTPIPAEPENVAVVSPPAGDPMPCTAETTAAVAGHPCAPENEESSPAAPLRDRACEERDCEASVTSHRSEFRSVAAGTSEPDAILVTVEAQTSPLPETTPVVAPKDEVCLMHAEIQVSQSMRSASVTTETHFMHRGSQSQRVVTVEEGTLTETDSLDGDREASTDGERENRVRPPADAPVDFELEKPMSFYEIEDASDAPAAPRQTAAEASLPARRPLSAPRQTRTSRMRQERSSLDGKDHPRTAHKVVQRDESTAPRAAGEPSPPVTESKKQRGSSRHLDDKGKEQVAKLQSLLCRLATSTAPSSRDVGSPPMVPAELDDGISAAVQQIWHDCSAATRSYLQAFLDVESNATELYCRGVLEQMVYAGICPGSDHVLFEPEIEAMYQSCLEQRGRLRACILGPMRSGKSTMAYLFVKFLVDRISARAKEGHVHSAVRGSDAAGEETSRRFFLDKQLLLVFPVNWSRLLHLNSAIDVFFCRFMSDLVAALCRQRPSFGPYRAGLCSFVRRCLNGRGHHISVGQMPLDFASRFPNMAGVLLSTVVQLQYLWAEGTSDAMDMFVRIVLSLPRVVAQTSGFADALLVYDHLDATVGLRMHKQAVADEPIVDCSCDLSVMISSNLNQSLLAPIILSCVDPQRLMKEFFAAAPPSDKGTGGRAAGTSEVILDSLDAVETTGVVSLRRLYELYPGLPGKFSLTDGVRQIDSMDAAVLQGCPAFLSRLVDLHRQQQAGVVLSSPGALSFASPPPTKRAGQSTSPGGIPSSAHLAHRTIFFASPILRQIMPRLFVAEPSTSQ